MKERNEYEMNHRRPMGASRDLKKPLPGKKAAILLHGRHTHPSKGRYNALHAYNRELLLKQKRKEIRDL